MVDIFSIGLKSKLAASRSNVCMSQRVRDRLTRFANDHVASVGVNRRRLRWEPTEWFQEAFQRFTRGRSMSGSGQNRKSSPARVMSSLPPGSRHVDRR
jgi:hypothetical protein